jgi:general secretion pathway protein G
MYQRIRKAMKEQSGFTLIELLIVIVILGILAAIVVFSVSGITDRGKSSACKSDVATVTTAVEAYYAAQVTNPSYPVDQAAAATALIPKFLHGTTWPADVTYALTNGSPDIQGVGC